MDPIMAIARRHGIAVVEDTSQSCGSFYKQQHLGSIGDVGAFSFQLEKNITSGEGGALATSNEEVYKRAVKYGDQGGQFPVQHGGIRDLVGGDPFLGENLRMTEITGAILGCQLKRLDSILDRITHARTYVRDGLADLPIQLLVPAPDRDRHGLAVGFYTPTTDQARSYVDALRAEGVPATLVYGGKPVYAARQILEQRMIARGCPFSCTCTDHRKVTYSMGMCPRSEDLLGRFVAIGLGPMFSDDDLAAVVHGVRKVAAHLM
jgi:8-amino-3,8-dideoxy-alpha-D-manno-octulosonate transaminase